MSARIESIYRGQPKKLHDQRGDWVSSIERDTVHGFAEVLMTGLSGDKVAQPYHGSADAAICVHMCDHYRFWQQHYGLTLTPGSVGENFALDGITEDEIFVGDIMRTGTALLQVSGPRVPCANLARHIGRPDWVRLTVEQNRTGFYARVLEPGTASSGDAWHLQERLNRMGSIPSLNRCIYLSFDPDFAQQASGLIGLAAWWKQQFRDKLKNQQDHWTQGMAH
jgi:MOSC domain-containing protein YiiM